MKETKKKKKIFTKNLIIVLNLFYSPGYYEFQVNLTEKYKCGTCTEIPYLWYNNQINMNNLIPFLI
jgi:hypothetical protein